MEESFLFKQPQFLSPCNQNKTIMMLFTTKEKSDKGCTWQKNQEPCYPLDFCGNKVYLNNYLNALHAI